MSFAYHPGLLASIEATKVVYRRLGNSGLRVSVPILGAMSLGSKSITGMEWTIEADEALPLLKAAYDRGLNTWDTANVYSNGESERLIGRAIKEYNIPREKVIILTKCFQSVMEDNSSSFTHGEVSITKSKDYVNQGGLSRAAIFNQVSKSLERLGLDYIDLFMVHRFDKHTPIEETMKALDDLVRSGKVRYIGASSMWATQFARMQFVAEKNGWTKFVSMQNEYSLLYREEEREMIRFCNDTGVGLIPWAPLCRGHLARPPASFGSTSRSAPEVKLALPVYESGKSPRDQEIVKRVIEIAEKKDWRMSTVALAWVNKRVTSPIVGLSSIARMDEALESVGKELTEEEEKYLEELYVPRPVTGFS